MIYTYILKHLRTGKEHYISTFTSLKIGDKIGWGYDDVTQYIAYYEVIREI